MVNETGTGVEEHVGRIEPCELVALQEAIRGDKLEWLNPEDKTQNVTAPRTIPWVSASSGEQSTLRGAPH